MEKTYYLVHIAFEKNSSLNTYQVWKYHKSVRFTPKQAWKFMRRNSCLYSGHVPMGATVDYAWKVIEKHNLNAKMVNNYYNFDFLLN